MIAKTTSIAEWTVPRRRASGNYVIVLIPSGGGRDTIPTPSAQVRDGLSRHVEQHSYRLDLCPALFDTCRTAVP
jgi:hypothetical protein